MDGGVIQLVDRIDQLDRLRTSLAAAARGDGSLLILRGEAGIGKTTLLEAAAKAARGMGFEAGIGISLGESTGLYHPWVEALRAIGLDHLLVEEPPPRLHGLYLISGSSLLVAKAERGQLETDADLFAAMSSAVADFLSDALGKTAGAGEGEILRLAHGQRGIVVTRGPEFALAAVVEGRESELFLEEMRRLVAKVHRSAGGKIAIWQGRTDLTESLTSVLSAVIGSGRWDGIDIAENGQARKYNLFDNVLLGLSRRSESKPVMLVVDDIQWADPSSLALLLYLARNLRKNPVLLIAAYRIEEKGVNEQLAHVLQALAVEDLGTDIELGPLSQSYSQEFVERLIGRHELPQEFFDVLVRETQGNPLYIREVMRALSEDGALEPSGTESAIRLTRPLEKLGVPKKVRGVIALRLRRLREDERALLDSAAVCGTRFVGSLAAKVLGEPEAKALRTLNSVSRIHGLIRSEGKYWRFDHPMMREVLYDELSEDLRALYHRSAAELLEHAAAPAEEIGDHYAAAKDPRAVPHLKRAADSFVASGAHDGAASHLRKALEVAADPDRAGLLTTLADVLEIDAKYPDCLDVLAKAMAAGAPRGACLRKRSSVLTKLGRYDEAVASAKEAQEVAVGDEWGDAVVAEAFALENQSRHEAAAAVAREVLDAPKTAVGLPARAAALEVVGLSQAYRAKFDEAIRAGTEAQRIHAESGNRRGEANSLHILGTAHCQRADLDMALELVSKSQAIRESIGDRHGATQSLNAKGKILIARGEFDSALASFGRSLAIQESIGDRGGIAWTLKYVGVVHLCRGSFEEALSFLRRCAVLSAELGDRLCEAVATMELGAVRAEQGDAKEALESLSRAQEMFRKSDDPHLVGWSLFQSVGPLLQLGELSRARDAGEESLRLMSEASTRDDEALALGALALCDAAEGEFAKAAAKLEEALEIQKSFGLRFEAAQTQQSLAEVLRDAGDSAKAREHALEALGTYETLNVPLRAAQLRASLADLV